MKEETKAKAAAISQFLIDHKGLEVTTIDVEQECSWTECFIICTVTSVGHLRGLARELWGVLDELGLQVNNRHLSLIHI